MDNNNNNNGGDKTTPLKVGFYEASGGAGGKLRKPPSRKPPPTPYSRPPPPPNQASTAAADRGGGGGYHRRRWLSSIVDPAYRIISGGATLLFSSVFSSPSSSAALPAPGVQHHDKQDTEIDQNATGDDEHNGDTNNLVTRITGTEGPTNAGDSSREGSDVDGQSLDRNRDTSNLAGISDIEQLLQGKKFSRDEANRLLEIIQSRSVELPNAEHESIDVKEAKGTVVTHVVPNVSSGEIQEDMSKAIWGTSTPLPQSLMRGDIVASPIDIAKAYMGSRTLDTDNRPISRNDDFTSTPFIPASSSKPSTCWPGSMVQDQRDYSSPQSVRGRHGLHNIPRTPYSRTIFSKSKFTPFQGGNDKTPRTTSTFFKQVQTPVYGQTSEKRRGDALDGGYGSVGPIRRTRHKVATPTPPRGSPYVNPPSIGTSQAESSYIRKDFLLSGKKNFELGRSSGNSLFQSVDKKPSSFQVGVPQQSSQIARTILEHINRNSPTPKDKSEELKLAMSWKKPSASDIPLLQNGDDSSLIRGSSLRNDNQKRPVLENAEKWNSLFKETLSKTTVKATDVVSNGLAGDGSDGRFSVKDFPKTTPDAVGSEVLNQQKKPLFQPSGTKRVFPSMSIDKPDTTWKLSSDKSSSFTFPVPTSSAVFYEPPTPSFMPSFSATSEHQPKDGDAASPTYNFGSQKSDRLVFTFPSTSNTVQNVSPDIKFSFGSVKPRLSFKDAICH